MTNNLTKDIIQWDIKSWSRVLDFWDEKINWDQVHNGLELGGRKGGLSLWLALKNKEVVCSDMKDAEISASPLHSKYNITSRIKYQNIDATDIPYDNHFDVIVFKSIISSIGSGDQFDMQDKFFKEVHKALRPGGKALFVENLCATHLHQFLRKKFVKWGDSCRYATLDEMNGFLKRFSSFSIKTTGVIGTFGRNENQRQFLATIDQLALNKICPDNWKYICYGIAVK